MDDVEEEMQALLDAGGSYDLLDASALGLAIACTIAVLDALPYDRQYPEAARRAQLLGLLLLMVPDEDQRTALGFEARRLTGRPADLTDRPVLH